MVCANDKLDHLQYGGRFEQTVCFLESGWPPLFLGPSRVLFADPIAATSRPVAASGMIFFGDPVTMGSVSAVFVGFVAGAQSVSTRPRQARSGR